MGLILPTDEIKRTLANADETMRRVQETIPDVQRVAVTTNAILDDLKAITGALRAIFVRPTL